MVGTRWRVTRRDILGGAAALGGAGLVLPGRAPAQGGAKPFQGTTLNVSMFTHPTVRAWIEYAPEFEAASGIKLVFDTPGFPVYNQRMDLELSTRGPAYDVMTVTFIYSNRWIGSGWVHPLDELIKDPERTPAGFDADDFLEAVRVPFRDRTGRTCGLPWVGEAYMAAGCRFDLMQKAGLGMPQDFDQVLALMELAKKERMAGFITENHYGWSFIPYLNGFGGRVFRAPPDDLMPMLDSPEAIEATEYFARLLRDFGPDGALSYTNDQSLAISRQGRVMYYTFNLPYLALLADKGSSKVAQTVNYSIMPSGPKGRFPGLATHGIGIPAGSRKKEAAWEFIKWAVSRDMMRRLLVEKNQTAQTRRSVIGGPDYKSRLTLNGVDVADIYLKTMDLAASGYMAYRTVAVYPQVDKQIDKLIENVVSGQMTARQAARLSQENAIADLKRAGVNL